MGPVGSGSELTLGVGNSFNESALDTSAFRRCVRTSEAAFRLVLRCDAPIRGRFVGVFGRDLVLCEVEVFSGEKPNQMALEGKSFFQRHATPQRGPG